MPIGLCNVPSTFERLMDKVFHALNHVCLIYLDDIIVKSATFESHVKNLSLVFDRLRAAGLKLAPKKYNLFKTEVTFLGHVVSSKGISTDPRKIQAVTDWPVPVNVKELRSFVGLCSYYRKFIRDFATIAEPLHRLTEKNSKFEWTAECDSAFSRLKELLVPLF